jgi:hypothetical protein
MRSVFGMRLAVYGTIVVIAALLLALRATGDDSHAGLGRAIFHGQTPEGLLVAMTVEDGRAGSAYMRWRMTCDVDRTPEISTIRFGRQFGDRFTQRGSAFSFEGRDDQQVRRGYTTRYHVRFGGEISDDGRTIRGHGQTTEVWLRNGRVVDTCRSKNVKFRAYRGSVSP